MRRRAVLAVASVAAVGLTTACGEDDGSEAPVTDAATAITVASPAFDEDGPIPRRFTCDGSNTSPPLEISGVPDDAAGLVLLLEDPDAPGGTFIHWMMWGLPPHTSIIGPGEVPDGAVQGRNDLDDTAYGGPCPPEGEEHDYVFTVHALSEPLDLPEGASVDELDGAMGGTIIATGRLTGRYSR